MKFYKLILFILIVFFKTETLFSEKNLFNVNNIELKKSDNITNNVLADKAIKKGVGELDNVIIEEVSYEGYGPFGVAILIEAITDNKNRTVADIRHALSKFGGSLGQAGSVSWNFERNGIILIDKNEISENEIFEFSIENDCIEFFEDEEYYRLHFNSNDLYNKLDVLEKLSIKVDSSFLAYVPKDEIGLSEDENQKVEKLLEFLDDLEDVQNVFSNQTLGQS